MSKPEDYFRYKDGALETSGVALERIASEIGTPAYVYSAEALLEPLRALQKGLAPIDHLVCFAVKSNSNIGILRLLAHAGAGMDLVSGGELFRAAKAGVTADRIVFSGVGKTRDEMKEALLFGGRGIYSFNVESVPELAALNEVARSLGVVAPVALRLNPDVDPKTHPYISTGLKKNKFGVSRKEFLDVARSIRKYPSISLRGISIHIGSQLTSLGPLRDAFAKARELLEALDAILPEPVRFVDLGGGIGITYRNEKTPPVEKYCALVLENFGPRSGIRPGLRILLEPGRIIAGNSGALVTRVLYRKRRQAKDFLVLDAAMNDLIRPALYGSYHEVVPVRKRAGKLKRTSIVGPVCESADCFADERPFPASVGSGDLVAILSAGAYGFSMASNYNSRARPPEVLVEEGRFRVIRERERHEDLIRGERL